MSNYFDDFMDEDIPYGYEDNYDLKGKLFETAARADRVLKTLDALIKDCQTKDALPSKETLNTLWTARQEMYSVFNGVELIGNELDYDWTRFYEGRR